MTVPYLEKPKPDGRRLRLLFPKPIAGDEPICMTCMDLMDDFFEPSEETCPECGADWWERSED